MAQTVLVTGGNGYVGGWCIVALLRAGYDVRTTVRSLARADSVRSAVASQVEPGERLSFVAADLTADPGWAEAVDGVGGVLHVASPIDPVDARDRDAFVRPAVDGTLRVLRAAVAAGVPRVVLTSSAAAATPEPKGDVVIDAALWTDPNQPGLSYYRLSKTLAEKAAWDCIAESSGATELVTVLPGAILGPVLPGVSKSSAGLVGRMLEGAVPAVPKIEMGVVDVRDLADLHVRAFTTPTAAGRRFLASGDVITMSEIARMLREDLGPAAAKVPTRAMPDLLLRLAARFRPEFATLVPMLGRRLTIAGEPAREILDWSPRPVRETVTDTGRSLLAA